LDRAANPCPRRNKSPGVQFADIKHVLLISVDGLH
jgi:hypothetical protein